MRKITGLFSLLACFVLLPSGGMSQEPIRWEPTLESAQRLAAQTNRLVLIQFWAPWCVVCKRMETEVFSQPAVSSLINGKYVAVKINADDFPAVAHRYGLTGLPTTVITTPDGQMVDAIRGRLDTDPFVERAGRVAADLERRFAAEQLRLPGAGAAPTANQPPAAAAPTGTPQYNPPPPNAVASSSPAAQPAPQQPYPPADQPPRYGPAAGNAPPQNYSPPPYSPPPVASIPAAAPAQPYPSSPPYGAPATDQPPPPRYSDPPSTASQPPMQAPAAPPYGYQAPPAMPAGQTAPPYTPSAPAGAAPPVAPANTAPPTHNPPLCLDGFCPVTLCERQQWMPGDSRWGAIHRGRTYLFAGPEEQRRFFSDPDRYAPVGSGNDVVLASEQGRAVPGLREHGVFYVNRVFLFSSEESLARFAERPDVYANQVLNATRSGAANGRQVQ